MTKILSLRNPFLAGWVQGQVLSVTPGSWSNINFDGPCSPPKRSPQLTTCMPDSDEALHITPPIFRESIYDPTSHPSDLSIRL